MQYVSPMSVFVPTASLVLELLPLNQKLKMSHYLVSPEILLNTVKILKIGTPEIITIIVLQLEQLDFTVQYCVQEMQTE